MDILRRTLAQFRELYQAMSPSQRGTLVVVPLLVLGALGLLIYTNYGPSEEHLLGGKFFSPEELTRAQEALQQAGLSEFRVDGQRIAVPGGDADRYTAALLSSQTLSASFASDFDRMLDDINMFTPNEHRRELMDERRKIKLSKILSQVEGIESAIVEWDRSEGVGTFRRSPTVTATVNVVPRGGQELSPQLVRSLRMVVAGAKAGLTPENVTVFDLHASKAYGGSLNGDVLDDPTLAVKKMRADEYEGRIRAHLEPSIPGVIVSVNVELDSVTHSVERQQQIDAKPFVAQSHVETNKLQSTQRPNRSEPGATSNRPLSVQFSGGIERNEVADRTLETALNLPSSVRTTEKTFDGLQPKSVSVAVSIPEDFYRDVALSRGLQEGTTEEEKKKFQATVDAIKAQKERDVAEQVRRLIPGDVPPDAVTVKSYVRLDTRRPEIKTPLVETLGSAATEWGSAAGLLLFALWALWLLQRSLKKLPAERATANMPTSSPALEAVEDEVENEQRSPSRRDELQAMVRDNPEMAAAVLSRWISPPK